VLHPSNPSGSIAHLSRIISAVPASFAKRLFSGCRVHFALEFIRNRLVLVWTFFQKLVFLKFMTGCALTGHALSAFIYERITAKGIQEFCWTSCKFLEAGLFECQALGVYWTLP